MNAWDLRGIDCTKTIIKMLISSCMDDSTDQNTISSFFICILYKNYFGEKLSLEGYSTWLFIDLNVWDQCFCDVSLFYFFVEKRVFHLLVHNQILTKL